MTLDQATIEALAARLLGAERFVIGVNPRSGDWHRQTLAMRPFGDAQKHAELQAPGLGMTTTPEEMRHYHDRFFRGQRATALPSPSSTSIARATSFKRRR